MPSIRQRGFTLIELMVAVAIVAILSAVALPAYNSYITRSRIPVALDALSAYRVRMEQRYQDTGSYGSGTCTPLPSTVDDGSNWTMTCALRTTAGGPGFLATVTGKGKMANYEYTIDQAGLRATTSHPKGTNATCWTTKGGSACDS
jgi:type IV pilus assembly protein PilE